jgi:putative membrane protein
MHWNYGAGYGWLLMVILWVVVIIGVVFLIKSILRSTKTERKTETPLEILKKRYAKGEISKEEFEEKKKDLA